MIKTSRKRGAGREAQHVACIKEKMNAYSIFGVKSKRKGTTRKN
jgi:hypothetical protein